MQTITVGPFGVFFTNKNKEMNLPGHSHAAEVLLTFLTVSNSNDDGRGFPSFHDTAECILAKLAEVLAKPIEGTNEKISRLLFAEFERWTPPEVERYGGRWTLLGVDLKVLGVRDKLGHAQGFTKYSVFITEQEATKNYAGWRMTR